MQNINFFKDTYTSETTKRCQEKAKSLKSYEKVAKFLLVKGRQVHKECRAADVTYGRAFAELWAAIPNYEQRVNAATEKARRFHNGATALAANLAQQKFPHLLEKEQKFLTPENRKLYDLFQHASYYREQAKAIFEEMGPGLFGKDLFDTDIIAWLQWLNVSTVSLDCMLMVLSEYVRMINSFAFEHPKGGKFLIGWDEDLSMNEAIFKHSEQAFKPAAVSEVTGEHLARARLDGAFDWSAIRSPFTIMRELVGLIEVARLLGDENKLLNFLTSRLSMPQIYFELRAFVNHHSAWCEEKRLFVIVHDSSRDLSLASFNQRL